MQNRQENSKVLDTVAHVLELLADKEYARLKKFAKMEISGKQIQSVLDLNELTLRVPPKKTLHKLIELYPREEGKEWAVDVRLCCNEFEICELVLKMVLKDTGKPLCDAVIQDIGV
jgi:hypothetical protein